MRVQEAILRRPPSCRTISAIHVRFKLAEQFGVSLAALKTYARRLEALVRPTVASHLLAGLLGCLPEAYQQSLARGSHIMLVSRLMDAIKNDEGLHIAELGKVASAASALARSMVKRSPARKSQETLARKRAAAPNGGPLRMAEAVRNLYGLSWPPASPTPKPG